MAIVLCPMCDTEYVIVKRKIELDESKRVRERARVN